MRGMLQLALYCAFVSLKVLASLLAEPEGIIAVPNAKIERPLSTGSAVTLLEYQSSRQ
jgi:hypothetical protein